MAESFGKAHTAKQFDLTQSSLKFSLNSNDAICITFQLSEKSFPSIMFTCDWTLALVKMSEHDDSVESSLNSSGLKMTKLLIIPCVHLAEI